MLLGESPCAPVPAGVSSNVPLPVPFGLPKTTVIERVLASEKNNIWEHGRTFILTLVVIDRVLARRQSCARDRSTT